MRGLDRPKDRSFWMSERFFFCRLGLLQTGQRPDSQSVTLQHTDTQKSQISEKSRFEEREGDSRGYIFEATGVKVVSTFQFSVFLPFQIAQTNMTQQVVLSRRFFGNGVDFCITGTGFARPF